MAKVFIDGAVGTTGLEIHRRLQRRSDIELIALDDATRKSPSARRDALNASDISILCLPDDAAREAVGWIESDQTRVIDASTAHRTEPGWVYGFPEISGHDAVAVAQRVSNPGCYATGFVALIAPLVRAGVIPPDYPLNCNAVSGYSGGGKTMIDDYETGAAGSAWRTYALGLDHKHLPEMQAFSGLTRAPLFAPTVANTHRGMIVEVPLQLATLPDLASVAAIREVFASTYSASNMVRLLPASDVTTVGIEWAAEYDRLDIFVFANEAGTQVRLVAALDNLGKGAAGAAVQNLNIMLDLPETTGLRT